MSQEPVYYQPPDDHDAHIRAMVKTLAWGFGLLALMILLLIIFAPHIARWLPFSAEKRFVKPYEVMADKWLGHHAGDPEVQAYLQALGDDLAYAMDMPDSFDVTVHYVESDISNAFATLGGHVFIFRGVLNTIDDENSLAMVIAHELAHVRERHPVVAMSRGAAIQLVFAFATGQTGADTLASFGGDMGMLFFSREQEEQADTIALHALQNHYGHVSGFDRFFAELDKVSGDIDDDFPEFLQTHPHLDSRIERLSALIEDEGYRQRDTVALPTWLREHLEEGIEEEEEE